ncbi:YhgE/Pip domain-containing protein [Halalkalibacter nanhaiisediminis]|uniref:Putative membrane protein n=1 Tax=Halalkalibacter nanhaiisediminis TaxID=688079 RepID=A0A562QHE7_9BACI|nr:YhgE/Pip domain-containing protein [Halalkalibacter nanhaiisediminis]TWI56159.1 putative membrane protein [Halalkalibacter nanhaiisediminis]
MKLSYIKTEWLNVLQNKKVLISVIAILFVPILYAGMFLWAFWDPYEQLSDLPVAIVNEDNGAEFEGEKLHLGNDLVEKLKESNDFQFTFINKEQAMNDLQTQKYYLVVEIPSTFSEHATTLLEDNPKKMELTYIPNESYNFLSAQIGATAVNQIKSALAEKVTETYAETLFKKLQEVGDGFNQAGDGASQINAGAAELSNGANQLKNNLALLAEKSIIFDQGMAQASEGSTKLNAGIGELSVGLSQLVNAEQELQAGAGKMNAGTTTLVQGFEQTESGTHTLTASLEKVVQGTAALQGGANTLATSLVDLETKSDQLADGAKQIQQGMNLLTERITPMLEQMSPEQKQQLTVILTQLNEGSTQVANGTAALSQASGQLSGGAKQLEGSLSEVNKGQKEIVNGSQQLANALNQLSTGGKELLTGTTTLHEGLTLFGDKLQQAEAGSKHLLGGSNDLSNGLHQLEEGSGQFKSGSQQLADGANTLSNGTNEFEEGTSKLKDKLLDAGSKVNEVQADKDTYNMMAAPVEVQSESFHHVPNYGTGFAPYFLSLGLFVGALLLSIVYPMREVATEGKNGLVVFFGKFSFLAAVGMLQALLAAGILLVGLGIEVQSVPLFILTSIITSLTFIALVQCLVTLLADPGRFVAIIILILQLTTSAGTFPLELIPQALQPFNAILPMTYSVQAFKAVISSGDFSFMWSNLGILFLYMIGFMTITLSYFIVKQSRKTKLSTAE